MSTLFSLSVPLILASQSPRRRALLDQLGLDYRVQVSPANETTEEPLPPTDTARTLASKKARPVADEHPSALVLAADTVVIHDGDLLGKPTSPAHAYRMLRRLSNTTHRVYTGTALHHRETDRIVTTGRTTKVRFAPLSDAEIQAYVETGSPMDKAGGYGIQDHTGPLFVENLEGDYYNVVGLPLHRLYHTLQEQFSDFIGE